MSLMLFHFGFLKPAIQKVELQTLRYFRQKHVGVFVGVYNIDTKQQLQQRQPNTGQPQQYGEV